MSGWLGRGIALFLLLGMSTRQVLSEIPPPPDVSAPLAKPTAIPPAPNPLPPLPSDDSIPRTVPAPKLTMPSATPLNDKPAVPSPRRAPHITVEWVAPPSANVGQTIHQELIVRNLNQEAVQGVRVELPLPSTVRFLSSDPRPVQTTTPLIWDLGTVDATSERRIRLELEPKSEGDLTLNAKVILSTTCTAGIKLTRPKLEVRMTGPDSALIGETVVFQISLSNTGTGPIHRILLRDRLPAGLHHPAGELLEAEVAGLEPGESRTVMLRTTAVKTGDFEHEIEAFADGQAMTVQRVSNLRESTIASTSKTSIRIVEPALSLHVTAPKICLVKCDSLIAIEVNNPGTAAARHIRVIARIPDGTDFVAVDEGGRYDPVSRTVHWACPMLEPSGKRVWTIKVRGATLGTTTCAAVAVAEPNLTARGDAAISIEGVPALSLEVIDLDDPSPVDTDAQYEIRVINQGTCPCTGIQIVAQLPEGMELREASAPASYKVVGQQVLFAPFAKLATKADLVYRLKVRSQTPGDVRFRVQLTCDQLQKPVFKEESSRFFRPDGSGNNGDRSSR